MRWNNRMTTHTHCHIPPVEWSATCGELRLLWSRNAKRGSLIPLSLALAYFVRPSVEIDLTTNPPTIGPNSKETT
jgi:hypothetical protein